MSCRAHAIIINRIINIILIIVFTITIRIINININTILNIFITSVIITTNLDFTEWYDLFQRKPLVDALLDRLKHHCTTIRIDGPSLRVPVSKQ